MDASPPPHIRIRLRELLQDALVVDGHASGPGREIALRGVDAARIRQLHTLTQALHIDVVSLLLELQPPHVWLLAPHLFLQCATPEDWSARTRLLLCDCLDRLHGAPQPAATMVRSILREEDPVLAQGMLTVAWEAILRCGLSADQSPEAVLFAQDMHPDAIAALVAAALLGPESATAPIESPDLIALAEALIEADARLRAWLWPRLLAYADPALRLPARYAA